jgi:tripartite-type tricarboxylate transporter receptor subunit TctC
MSQAPFVPCRSGRRRALGHLGAGLMLSSGLRAQPAYPTKTVRVLTPFPAGSGPDASLRLVAEQLAKRWGQPVLVDNKPGGNGFIAVSAFKQGADDGHELIQLDSNHTTTHPHTFTRLPYSVEQDFAPLAMLLRTPFFVAVGSGSPHRSIDDLLQAALARPEKMFYGSWFNGSPGHIGALRLQARTGTRMTHVPFRDFGALYSAVAAGEVDWAFGSVASAGALERAGRLRFLAVAAERRDRLYPNVPASAEIASIKGLTVEAWAGLFAPAALAAPLQARIASDVRSALAEPDVVSRYQTLGYEAPPVALGDFGRLIRQETAEWGQLIRAANLKLD